MLSKVAPIPPGSDVLKAHWYAASKYTAATKREMGGSEPCAHSATGSRKGCYA